MIDLTIFHTDPHTAANCFFIQVLSIPLNAPINVNPT